MSVIRTIFMGTPEFAKVHLAELLKDEHFEVVAVITQPDRPSGRKLKLSPCVTKLLAQEKSIPVLSPENINSPECIEQIESFKAEACVVVAFGQIISNKILNIFNKKIVNVHGSLLPKWRGAAPIQRSIEAGDKQTGVCLQILEQKLDSGPVIAAKKIEISKTMDAIELHDELAKLGTQILHVEFMDYLRGNLTAIEQDESEVTYASKILKSEAKIDWKISAVDIYNKFKAFKLGPGVSAEFAGKKVKFKAMELVDEASDKRGQVISLDKNSFVIGGGTACLKILEIQPESKKSMSAGEFIRGYQLKEGNCFE